MDEVEALVSEYIGLGDWTIFAISVASLVMWLLVLWREQDHLRDHSAVPEGVRGALIIAVLAANIGGLITALGFAHQLTTADSAIVGAMWRTSVLTAGIYGLIASVRDGDVPKH